MKDLIIRFAKDYDVEDMAEIHAIGKKVAYSGIIDNNYLDRSVNDLDYRNEQMWKRYDSRNSIVAELNGDIVGFAQWVFGNESSGLGYAMSELCSLYIHPEYKGNGIGTALINRVKQLCSAAGCKNLQLYCLEQNTRSINFYKKHGGQIVDKKMLNFGEKEYKAVVFYFELTGN